LPNEPVGALQGHGRGLSVERIIRNPRARRGGEITAAVAALYSLMTYTLAAMRAGFARGHRRQQPADCDQPNAKPEWK